MKIEMGEEENSDQPYRRSLDEIKAMILEIQARNKVDHERDQGIRHGVGLDPVAIRGRRKQ